MQSFRQWTRCGAVLAALAALAVPASASTFVRAGLDELMASNGTVVMGQVLDAHSYWNADRSFIFTDVRLATDQVVKGRAGSEITVTVMGGTVGETTTLVLGAPVLVPGRTYVLFLNRENLPGHRALTVRDQVQGAFEVLATGNGLRAYSQALDHALLPDLFGAAEPPGGKAGLPLEDLLSTLRAIHRSSR